MKALWMLANLLAAPAMAQPMWEQADTWRCDLERHMRAPSGETVVEMDPGGRGYTIDFKASTVSSAFVDGTASTTHRSYYEAQAVRYNIMVNDWDYGQYPSVIMEQDGQFWSVGGSGSLAAGDEVWVAVYQCRTVPPQT